MEAINSEILEETKMSCRATYPSTKSHQTIATTVAGTIHVPKPHNTPRACRQPKRVLHSIQFNSHKDRPYSTELIYILTYIT